MSLLETAIFVKWGDGSILVVSGSWLELGLHKSNSNVEHCMRNKKKIALHVEQLHKGMAHPAHIVHPKPLKHLKKMY